MLVRSILLDSWRCLAYERSRAQSALDALVRWKVGLSARANRIQRLGWSAFSTLLEVERRCGEHGLVFSARDAGCTAPWHLPESLLLGTLQSLPDHPLIDKGYVASLLMEAGLPVDVGALQTLEHLLRPTDLARRWPAATEFSAPCLSIPGASTSRIAICVHLYYPELWSEILEALSHLCEPWDLFVSVPTFAATPVLHEISRAAPACRFLVTPNRGRDVAPWLTWIASAAFDGYDLVCKVHTKRSPHRKDGAAWRKSLLDSILGRDVNETIEFLRARKDIGVAGPASSLIRPGSQAWLGTNRLAMANMQERLGVDFSRQPRAFFAGTMFWFRPQAVRALGQLSEVGFPAEMGQTDGTYAHAIERLVPIAAEVAGLETAVLPEWGAAVKPEDTAQLG